MATEKPRYKWARNPDPRQAKSCKFLGDCLLDFPDEDTTRQPSDAGPKQQTIVNCLTARHRQQRHRILERHVAQYEEWQADTNAQIDLEEPYPDNPELEQDFNEQATKLINSAAAKEALNELPASERSVLICVDQLKADPYLRLAHTELALEAAKQEADLRAEMVAEEEELHAFQIESREMYYSSILREAKREMEKSGAGGAAGAGGGGFAGVYRGAPIVPNASAPTNPRDPRMANSNSHDLYRR